VWRVKVKFFAVLLTVCALMVSGYAQPRETTDDDIDRKIEGLKKYLWALQEPNGIWEKYHYAYRYHLPGNYASAIVTYALLEAGADYENDPRMKKAVEYLVSLGKKPPMSVRAFRVMALGQIGRASCRERV